MKLKTSSGEFHFNPQTISHVHLNADRTLLTVHFTEGTHQGFEADTDADHVFFAEFLAKLTDESSGFVAIGNEVLNLVLARGYLAKLVDNGRITRYLNQNHPDIFRELQSMLERSSLDG